MSLYYKDDFVELYLGDCLTEHREWLEADVLVTDPPYGIGWSINNYLTPGRSKGNMSTPHAGIQNDEDTSARDAAMNAWGNGPALVFGSIMRPFPAGTRRVLVWQKPADSGVMGSIIWRQDWEPVFMAGKWDRTPVTDSSIIKTAAGSHRQYAQGVHPHAKPLDVMEHLIDRCPPGVIADPFAGAGSTLVAAKALGRRAIGVELEEKYCEIIAKRCAQDVFDFGTLA